MDAAAHKNIKLELVGCHEAALNHDHVITRDTYQLPSLVVSRVVVLRSGIVLEVPHHVTL